MKEFIEKLIGRLEEQKSEHLHDEEVTQGLGKINLASFCSAKARAIDGAIEIVNQLASDYKDKSVKGDLISKGELKKSLEKITVTINWDEVNKIKDDVQFVEAIIHNCTEIVLKHIDEQPTAYNDGWIPCSERLPEEKEQERILFDPITLAEMDVERYMASDLVNVTVRHYDSDDLFVSDDCTVDGKWVNFDGEEYEVIAWQPLPAPYQPKGE